MKKSEQLLQNEQKLQKLKKNLRTSFRNFKMRLENLLISRDIVSVEN